MPTHRIDHWWNSPDRCADRTVYSSCDLYMLCKNSKYFWKWHALRPSKICDRILGHTFGPVIVRLLASLPRYTCGILGCPSPVRMRICYYLTVIDSMDFYRLIA